MGEWLTLKRNFGGYLPDEYLWVMLMDMLPDDVAQDIRDRPHLNSVLKVTDYVTGELARYNDRHLGKIHDNEAAESPDSIPKNAVNSFVEAEKK